MTSRAIAAVALVVVAAVTAGCGDGGRDMAAGAGVKNFEPVSRIPDGRQECKKSRKGEPWMERCWVWRGKDVKYTCLTYAGHEDLSFECARGRFNVDIVSEEEARSQGYTGS